MLVMGTRTHTHTHTYIHTLTYTHLQFKAVNEPTAAEHSKTHASNVSVTCWIYCVFRYVVCDCVCVTVCDCIHVIILCLCVCTGMFSTDFSQTDSSELLNVFWLTSVNECYEV